MNAVANPVQLVNDYLQKKGYHSTENYFFSIDNGVAKWQCVKRIKDIAFMKSAYGKSKKVALSVVCEKILEHIKKDERLETIKCDEIEDDKIKLMDSMIKGITSNLKDELNDKNVLNILRQQCGEAMTKITNEGNGFKCFMSVQRPFAIGVTEKRSSKLNARRQAAHSILAEIRLRRLNCRQSFLVNGVDISHHKLPPALISREENKEEVIHESETLRKESKSLAELESFIEKKELLNKSVEDLFENCSRLLRQCCDQEKWNSMFGDNGQLTKYDLSIFDSYNEKVKANEIRFGKSIEAKPSSIWFDNLMTSKWNIPGLKIPFKFPSDGNRIPPEFFENVFDDLNKKTGLITDMDDSYYEFIHYLANSFLSLSDGKFLFILPTDLTVTLIRDDVFQPNHVGIFNNYCSIFRSDLRLIFTSINSALYQLDVLLNGREFIVVDISFNHHPNVYLLLLLIYDYILQNPSIRLLVISDDKYRKELKCFNSIQQFSYPKVMDYKSIYREEYEVDDNIECMSSIRFFTQHFSSMLKENVLILCSSKHQIDEWVNQLNQSTVIKKFHLITSRISIAQFYKVYKQLMNAGSHIVVTDPTIYSLPKLPRISHVVDCRNLLSIDSDNSATKHISRFHLLTANSRSYITLKGKCKKEKKDKPQVIDDGMLREFIVLLKKYNYSDMSILTKDMYPPIDLQFLDKTLKDLAHQKILVYVNQFQSILTSFGHILSEIPLPLVYSEMLLNGILFGDGETVFNFIFQLVSNNFNLEMSNMFDWELMENGNYRQFILRNIWENFINNFLTHKFIDEFKENKMNFTNISKCLIFPFYYYRSIEHNHHIKQDIQIKAIFRHLFPNGQNINLNEKLLIFQYIGFLLGETDPHPLVQKKRLWKKKLTLSKHLHLLKQFQKISYNLRENYGMLLQKDSNTIYRNLYGKGQLFSQILPHYYEFLNITALAFRK
ncbi:hypothetical protein SNEBB_007216 [Seison nebaliae]|nr:hypothetical protein SNEBB_007216 [Seison nebaliae]